MNRKTMIGMLANVDGLKFYNTNWGKNHRIKYIMMDNEGYLISDLEDYYHDNEVDNWEIYTPTLTWEQAYEEMKKGKICQMVGTNRICRWNNKLETKSQENEWIPEIYLSVNSAYSSNWQLVEDEQDKKYSIFGILDRFNKDKTKRKYMCNEYKNKFEIEIEKGELTHIGTGMIVIDYFKEDWQEVI